MTEGNTSGRSSTDAGSASALAAGTPIFDRAWPTLPKGHKACLVLPFEFIDEIPGLVRLVAPLLEHATVGIMGPLVQASSVDLRLEARKDDERAPCATSVGTAPFLVHLFAVPNDVLDLLRDSSCWYTRRTILLPQCNRRTAGAVHSSSICPKADS